MELTSEYDQVEVKISQAVSRELRTVFFNYKLCQNTILQLQAAGYKVETIELNRTGNIGHLVSGW